MKDRFERSLLSLWRRNLSRTETSVVRTQVQGRDDKRPTHWNSSNGLERLGVTGVDTLLLLLSWRRTIPKHFPVSCLTCIFRIDHRWCVVYELRTNQQNGPSKTVRGHQGKDDEYGTRTRPGSPNEDPSLTSFRLPYGKGTDSMPTDTEGRTTVRGGMTRGEKTGRTNARDCCVRRHNTLRDAPSEVPFLGSLRSQVAGRSLTLGGRRHTYSNFLPGRVSPELYWCRNPPVPRLPGREGRSKDWTV